MAVFLVQAIATKRAKGHTPAAKGTTVTLVKRSDLEAAEAESLAEVQEPFYQSAAAEQDIADP